MWISISINLNRVVEPPIPNANCALAQISKHWLKFQVEETMFEPSLVWQGEKRKEQSGLRSGLKVSTSILSFHFRKYIGVCGKWSVSLANFTIIYFTMLYKLPNGEHIISFWSSPPPSFLPVEVWRGGGG